ncbi:22093_t:CDS:2 [Rhizophagus irregularis]|nr:22093_t:CDS:2 [Rhizophagus irregularis]
MFFRVLGVTSLVAVVATNTSRVVHPQDRYHTKNQGVDIDPTNITKKSKSKRSKSNKRNTNRHL